MRDAGFYVVLYAQVIGLHGRLNRYVSAGQGHSDPLVTSCTPGVPGPVTCRNRLRAP